MDASTFRDFLLVREPKSKETIRNYTDAVKRFQRDYDLDLSLFASSPDAAEREGDRVLARLRSEREGPNAFNLGVKTLNALARACRHKHVRWDKLPENQTEPRPFAEWELQKLLSYRSRRPGWKGREETSRRRALLWFAIYTAMRHGEIHRAKASHLDPAAGTYTVLKPSKNGDVRTIPIEPEFFSSGRPLMPWVQARPIDAADPDALWTSRLRWTKKPNTPKRLTYAQVGKDLKEIGRAVGVDVNFYRTRATRATALKRADVSDRTIQRILGHAKLETTTRYVQHLMVDVADDLRRHKPASPIKRPPRESES